MAYQNLKAEMTKSRVTQQRVSEFLGMSANNLNLKINEKIPFTVSEMKRIKEEFFPELSLDYLAASDSETAVEKLYGCEASR